MKSKHVLSALLFAAVAATLQGQAPDLSELEVAGRADFPRLAADAGGFVVVWRHEQDPYQYQLVGRRYARDGEALTGEVTLKTDFLGDATTSIASDDDGRFVVVWSQLDIDLPHVFTHDVYAQRFFPTGEPLTGEILINDHGDGDQSSPQVVSEAGGGFVAVWKGSGQDGDGSDVFARRFTAAGEPATGEILVNAATAGRQTRPAVALGDDGSFVVAWQLFDQPGVFARRFAAGGTPLTADVEVDVIASGHLRQPEVAVSADGGFVVAWRQSLPEPPPARGVFVRRFTAAGEPTGAATRLSLETGSLVLDPGGGSLLTWGVGWTGDASSGHFGQHFSAAGEPEGGVFRISPRLVPIYRSAGAVHTASFGDGDYVAVYQLDATSSQFGPRPAAIWGRLLPREARAGTLSFAPEIPSDLEPGVDWAAVESPRTVGLRVLRSGGATGDVGVDYFLDSGAARAGEDIAGTAGQLNFGEDEPLVKSFVLEILDDERPEDSEDAVFRLAAPFGGARLLAPETARLRIYDADFNPPELAPTRLGGETAVATYPGGHLLSPRVAVSPQGGFVVVWERSSVDFASEGVFAQLYDPAGRPRGEEIQIHSIPPAGRSAHDVVFERAATGEPGFVVLWRHGDGLVARRFDATGNARGAEFPIADCGSVADPDCVAVSPGARLATGAAGRLVAVWHYRTSHSGDTAVVRALVGPDNSVTAAAVTPAERHAHPAVATDQEGNSVVAWHDRERQLLTARRFDSTSQPLASFDLTPYAPWVQPFSAPLQIAMAAAGHFAAVWADVPGAGEHDVTARRFHREGEPLDAPFRVPSFPWGDFLSPVVDADAQGNFFTVWQQDDYSGGPLAEDGDGSGIFGRRDIWRWGQIGGEFRINTTTAGSQMNPDVAVDPGGNAIVVWTSRQSDDGGDLRQLEDSVMMQRFAPGHCVSDATILCLYDGRFELKVRWRDFEGHSGDGHAVALTSETGTFWFFDKDNVELVVKVLDGRSLTGHFWVFYGALSNVEYTLTVTDSVTGHSTEYHNPAGRFASVGDVTALPGG